MGSLDQRIKTIIPRPLRPIVRPVFFRLYRAAIRAQCSYLDWVNREPGVPPAMLRFRVSETASAEDFLAVGRKAAQDIQSALESVGRPLEGFTSILDFGCGCGRTLIWLAKDFPGNAFYGTDVDEASIEWCREHLPGVNFAVNAPVPPLAVPEGFFGLIYGVSVLTHLDEDHQLQWLAELRRVVKPGGLVVLSVHGERSWGGLPQIDLEILRHKGFLFKTSPKLHGVVPDWYHTAYHSREYVLRTFSAHFTIRAYREAGLGYQDLVVLER
jgi:SAM-dependent methyltransferase